MKTALLGCKGTTLDLLNAATAQNDFKIDLVVTLSRDSAEKNKVAFFKGSEILDYCKQRKIPNHTVTHYDLKDKEDVRFFKEARIDLLLVIGWERLIPDEVLSSLGKFACGMHGSPYGLPKGRGRSPLNWSIIGGHNKFITYLFKYTSGVDAGSIIGFKVFEITPFDNIATLHSKNRMAMYQLLKTYIPLIEKNNVVFWSQPPDKPSYYPKRTPDDSGVDWDQSTLQVYNLIRAVAPPYPPAYCYYRGKKIFILEAYPYDSTLFHHGIKPGTIVDVMLSLGQFVVKTIDGTLLIRKFSEADIHDFKIGDVLEGVDGDSILQRIKTMYDKEILDDEKEI